MPTHRLHWNSSLSRYMDPFLPTPVRPRKAGCGRPVEHGTFETREPKQQKGGHFSRDVTAVLRCNFN